MNRVAIIDLGSNSIRFIIMEVAKDGTYRLIYQEKKAIRLAEGMTQESPFLTEEAQERALSCLSVYRHIIQTHDVTKILAVATAAVRNAENGSSFLKKVRTLTNIPMTIISGKQEASLGFSGVIHTIALSDFLLFDLGGASLEISVVKNHKRLHSISIPTGALTLTEKFHSQGTLSPATVKKIQTYVKNQLKNIPWLWNTGLPLVGIGGTLRNLGKIHQRKTNYPLAKIHNYEITSKNLLSIISQVVNATADERKKISGLSPERNDIISAGALIIGELVKCSNAKQIIISGCGLREGLFYHWYDPLYDKEGAQYKNMLISSAKNFYRTLPHEQNIHTHFVTALALSMFDQWQEALSLPLRLRNLLYTAGLLHDTGKTINYYNHERHSTYMISHARIYGWTHKEQIMCGLLTAFHHRFSGKLLKTLPEISLLTEKDIDQVKILSCLIALSEALDESYDASISQVICTAKDNHLEMRIYLSCKDISFYQYTTKTPIESFSKLCRRPLHVSWYPDSQKKALLKLIADVL